jgi:hypothetical protein
VDVIDTPSAISIAPPRVMPMSSVVSEHRQNRRPMVLPAPT